MTADTTNSLKHYDYQLAISCNQAQLGKQQPYQINPELVLNREVANSFSYGPTIRCISNFKFIFL